MTPFIGNPLPHFLGPPHLLGPPLLPLTVYWDPIYWGSPMYRDHPINWDPVYFPPQVLGLPHPNALGNPPMNWDPIYCPLP